MDLSVKNIFLAHGEADHEFAVRLSQFLELGCRVRCPPGEGLISSGEDLLSKAEEGLASDVLVLLLSEASWPVRWPREKWESILFEQAAAAGVELVSVLLRDCPFPQLLRRRNFIDGSSGPLAAMRLLKRWIWHREAETVQVLNSTFSSDLEDLYRTLSDQPGTLQAGGDEAQRFVKEAGQDFEAVFWIPCHQCSLAQIAGELGSQLGLILEGTVEQNCRSIQDVLAPRRCLLVLDSPVRKLVSALIPAGRTSTLVTTDPVKVPKRPKSLADARHLLSVRRYAEAYELLRELLETEVSTPDCARELAWICEHWDRTGEADSLRTLYRLPPTEQMSLF